MKTSMLETEEEVLHHGHWHRSQWTPRWTRCVSRRVGVCHVLWLEKIASLTTAIPVFDPSSFTSDGQHEFDGHEVDPCFQNLQERVRTSIGYESLRGSARGSYLSPPFQSLF